MSQRYDVHTLSVQMTVAPTTVTTVLDPDSYDKGYNAGEAEGHGVGYMEGHNEGFAAGETSGYQSGKSDGYAEGYGKGHTEGYTKGEQNGYDFGFDEGKKAEYGAFWDDFQWDGERVNYYGAFAGRGWSKNTLKPKHKIAPKDETNASQYASHLFYHCNRGNNVRSGIIDFRTIAHLFDFSGVINATRMFAESVIDYIVADLSNAQSMSECFSEGWGSIRTHITLTTSEKTVFHASTFDYTTKLTDLIFTDGSVIASSLSLSYSPLNKASITSIFDALSPSVSGQTLTLKKSAKEAAFTTSEWDALIATKSNWTISLI